MKASAANYLGSQMDPEFFNGCIDCIWQDECRASFTWIPLFQSEPRLVGQDQQSTFNMSFKTIPTSISIPSHEHRVHRISGWRPSYLRRRVLLAFLIVFCMIIAALETLNRLSERHNGIAPSIESRHYFWTYGPTAILTVVASFWSRVEFQAKQSAPWHSLQLGPQIAEKSVLLDYISPMQPVAIWRPLRNKHFVVAAGVTTSMLLRLLIVFSTGLFSLQQVHVQKVDVPIQIHSNFDAEKSSLNGLCSEA